MQPWLFTHIIFTILLFTNVFLWSRYTGDISLQLNPPLDGHFGANTSTKMRPTAVGTENELCNSPNSTFFPLLTKWLRNNTLTWSINKIRGSEEPHGERETVSHCCLTRLGQLCIIWKRICGHGWRTLLLKPTWIPIPRDDLRLYLWILLTIGLLSSLARFILLWHWLTKVKPTTS